MLGCWGCHCSSDEGGSDDARNFRKTHYKRSMVETAVTGLWTKSEREKNR